MIGSLNTFIGSDGLHPTQAGYEAIARTFFDAVRARLEVPPGTTLTGITARPPSLFGWADQ
jgi:hypothetical protein